MGIAYQSSIFDLKYIVGYYFNANKKVNTIADEMAFTRRRRRTTLIMVIWFLAMVVYWLADLSVNYFWFYFISDYSKTSEQPVDATFFMVFTYYFVGIQFIILTVLIIWQTTALILIIRVMGTRLANE